jgi:hypothetical protein
MATLKVGTGSTTPGSTAWTPYIPTGLYLDIDTSSAKFSSTPVYVASIGSTAGNQWTVAGVNGIYNPTATGFRVYIRWLDNSPLTPATANGFGWFINWIGVGS